ncbi:UNVERIFIED_CONTAM: Homeobox-DDT domain protein RLT1 [Sesamum calycinum]|uniref:Homeobox-DDT domain protein RLT1 n=1 Tax=Sesamum calycinum TaxID=2727403 RepID=A0AAW2SA98_9LAMI
MVDHNAVESGEMHSEDDKALLEKNKKRTVKTRAQVQALEAFYNEHKYPTESMKIQLAESIGLTEKQVSGWFCHRRLKDKRLLNGDNYVTGKQDRSSGVIQDRGSGLRQDSCGSTKQGDDRNFDTKEVESGRLTVQEYSAAELTYEHGGHYSGNHNQIDDASSGSSSSLRNMSNHHKGDHFDVATSRYLIPKFPRDIPGVKTRSGPSGYLKVKGQVENSAITAVKRQLGKHYREDGPPLGIEFDPLPPGAFESSMQDPVDETCYTEEAVLPALPDASKIRQLPKFGKKVADFVYLKRLRRMTLLRIPWSGSQASGYGYNSSVTSRNSNMDRTSFKVPQGSDFPDTYVHQKYKQNASLSPNGAYYPWRSSSEELPKVSGREISGSESKDEYGMRYRQAQGVEVMRMRSVSSNCHQQQFGGKSRGDEETSFHRYMDVCRKSSPGEKSADGSSNLAVKDGKTCAQRRIIMRIWSISLARTAPKRMRNEFPQQPLLKRSSAIDNQLETYRVIRSAAEVPSSYSEDEGSAGTSSSVE